MVDSSTKEIANNLLDGIRFLVSRKPNWREAKFHLSRAFWWTRQYLKLGFHEADLWSLDIHLSELLYLRLKKFREWFGGRSHPVNLDNSEQWCEIVDKMADAFKLIGQADGWYLDLTDEQRQQIDEGLDLFREYFFDLWD